MTPLLAAYFTPLFTSVLFPYGSLQVAAVWAVKHPVARMAALLPIFPMWRVIMIGMQPNAFEGGSLYGIIIVFVQWPCMVYLGIFVLVGVMCRLVVSKPELGTMQDDKVYTSSSTTIGEESTRE
jgi:hypothetical protein